MGPMTATREHVVLSGPPVVTPLVLTEPGLREWQAASEAAEQPDLCKHCDRPGHVVRWQLYPHPGECPEPGVLDELVEACFCCTWGPNGLVARAEAESVDDRDIQVEHLDRAGRWVAFERRF